MSDGLSNSELTHIASQLMAAKMFSLASCVMLFYDITLTMADEIEYIWSRKFTLLTILWTINRYVTPLAYIVITVSFNDPWSKPVCDRYVLFPEAVKIVTTSAIGVIFILRLYAIYSRNLVVAILTSLCLVVELAVKIWSFTDGTSLALPPGLVGCILTGKTYIRMAFTWIAELVFDSIVFFATLYRALKKTQGQHGSPGLWDRILIDGIMYFGVIFIVNLVTVLIFMLAPPDLKAINASFSTLITSLMVSRLVLNLRESSEKRRVTKLGGRVSDDKQTPGSVTSC